MVQGEWVERSLERRRGWRGTSGFAGETERKEKKKGSDRTGQGDGKWFRLSINAGAAGKGVKHATTLYRVRGLGNPQHNIRRQPGKGEKSPFHAPHPKRRPGSVQKKGTESARRTKPDSGRSLDEKNPTSKTYVCQAKGGVTRTELSARKKRTKKSARK